MVRVVKLTHEEEMKIYMRYTKKKLAEMFIICSANLDRAIKENYTFAHRHLMKGQ